MSNEMANSMLTIYPYFTYGDWVFDDESTGLKREPFVFGIPEMIDILVIDIPDARHGFKLYFSPTPFPGFLARLDWVREEHGGNWYRWDLRSMEGWLCAALFKYFDTAPKQIFCKAEPWPRPDGKD